MTRNFTITLLLITGLVVFPFSFLRATNYTNTGGSQTYNLKTGDTLRIASGTYTGNISDFNYGAVIVIANNGLFRPSSFSQPAGKVINYGIMQINFNLGTSNNFYLDNYSIANFQYDLAFWNGSAKNINNRFGGKITVNGSFSLDGNSNILNGGIININNDLSLYSSSSVFTNDGVLNVGDDLAMSAGQLINRNRINTYGDFDIWGGQFSNTGAIEPRGEIVFSAGTTYTNSCRLITQEGFTNYGTFQNNGTLWVGRTNTSADEFYNSGTFTNSATAKVKAVKFTNYSNIRGGGFLYFTGATYNSGTIGTSGSTTDTIKVFDATRTISSQIFDVQYGTVYNNTVFRSFAVPDTNEVPAGCSNTYMTWNAITLPVNWNYFYAKLVDQQPVLSWSAEFEANMQFIIERSYNNTDFSTVKTVISNSTAVYTYTDAAADMNQATIYYRIKGISADGSSKYTETRVLKPSARTSNVSVSVFPNPAVNKATINYTAERTEQLIIRLKNAAGQQISMKNVIANAGSNRFDIEEVKNLMPGVYFIDIINGNTIISTQKLIKQ